MLAASQAWLGREEEAHQAAVHLHEAAPDLHLDKLTEWLPIQRREHLSVFVEGLARAGFDS